MFSFCVLISWGFSVRKPWSESLFSGCRHWMNPQPRCLLSVMRSLKGEDASVERSNETCMASSLQQHKLEKLVANLVPAALGGHPSYLHTFLGTYRALATTQQVLDLLFQRYGCILPYTYDDSGPLHQLKHTSSKPAGETLLDREPATPLLPETAPKPEQRTMLS